MKTNSIAVLVFLLFMVGCATRQQKLDLSIVGDSGVSPTTYHRMQEHDDLSLFDLEDLAQHHVSDQITLRYLRDLRSIYYLTAKQVDQLRAKKVSDTVINYLLMTPKIYRYDDIDQYGAYGPYESFGPYGPFGPYYYPFYDPVIIHSYHGIPPNPNWHR